MRLKLFVQVMTLGFTLFTLFHCPDFACAAGFSTAAGMVTPRSEHTATLLPNGTVLVAGGHGANNQYLSSAEIYDPVTNSWSSAGTMSTPREGHTATFLPGGKVLVAGGAMSSGLLTAELYDPATNTWANVSNMPLFKVGHTATLLQNGKVLIAGGKNNQGTWWSTSELYDPAADTWTSSGTLSSARDMHTAALLPSGKVLVSGGWDGTNALGAELYDPAAGTWSATGTMVTVGRYRHTATVLATGKVLIAGGSQFSGGVLASAELYNPATNSWSATGSIITARYGHSANLRPDGKVLIAGGVQGTGASLASAETFDPATNLWTTAGSLAGSRYGHTATILASGTVFTVGGKSSSALYLATAELYDPATPAWSSAASMTVPRDCQTVTLLPNGKVLAAGGYSLTATSTALDSSELYNPATNSWSLVAGSMSTLRTIHTATVLLNGTVLVAGGRFMDGGYYYGSHTSAEIYDPATSSWSSTGSMSVKRESHSATLLPSGKVLVVGGAQSNPGYSLTILSSAEMYDPATGSWSSAGSLQTSRAGHTATLLPNGTVLVVGGTTSTFWPLASAELYDPATNSWSAAASMSTIRSGHTATLLPSGKLLIAGGKDVNVTLASAELYDPTTNSWSAAAPMSAIRSGHTATLLPNGKVLVMAGYGSGYLTSAELYDPATNSWSSGGSMINGREYHTTTLLPNGKVLVGGGRYYDAGLGSYRTLASVQLYDSGLGFSDSRRPAISSLTYAYNRVSLTGSRFKGDSEASSGGANSSSTNYPMLQLRNLSNEQTRFVAPDPSLPWSVTTFSSTSVASFPHGAFSATLYVNGIPSMSSIFLFRELAPVAGVSPTAVSFASIYTGSSSTVRTVTISNSGTDSLNVSAITLTGSYPSEFAVTTGTCPSLAPTITAGSSCTVKVTFIPTSGGAKSASLQVSSDDPANPSFPVALTGTGIIRYSLTVSHDGNGSGTISSYPGINISCASGVCSAPYAEGTVVTAYTTPTSSSVFTGWSAPCSGTGTCVLTMDADKSVTATFDLATVQIGATYYATLTAAFAASNAGDTLKLLAGMPPEIVSCSGTGTRTLRGGYDASYGSQSGMSTLLSLTIVSGTVIVDGIAIQ